MAFGVVSVYSGIPVFPFDCRVANLTESSLSVLCSLDMERSRNSSWSTSHLLPAEWQDEPRIFVHAATYYMCEVWDASSSHLLANATTAAAPTFLRPGESFASQILYPIPDTLCVTHHA